MDFLKRAGRILLIGLGVLLLLLVVGPFLVPVPPLEDAQPPQALAQPDSQFIELGFPGTDGLTVHYTDTGTGSGEPVFVLVHGYSDNLRTWEEIDEQLADLGRVVAYDQPGTGLTERLLPGDWGDINPYSDEGGLVILDLLLAELGIEQAVLVGNSAGGELAVQAALRMPEHVEALILVAPAIYAGGNPLPGWVFATPQLRRVGPLVMRSIYNQDVFGQNGYFDTDEYYDETEARYKITTRVENWDEAINEINAVTSGEIEIKDEVPQVDVPTLIIQGEADEIVPLELSQRAAEEIPDATLEVIPQCGHFPQDECAAPFMEAVRTWVMDQYGE